MKLIVLALVVWGLAGSSEAGGEPDWGAPAPAEELERANGYMSGRFGPELLESSLILVDSGLFNSGGEITGYFVCYRFFPPRYRGVYVPICIERYLADAEYTSGKGEIPNCAENPELCEVRISAAEALQIAVDAGLECELRRASIRLKLPSRAGPLVWLVGERPTGYTASSVDTDDWHWFRIDVHSGAVEKSGGH